MADQPLPRLDATSALVVVDMQEGFLRDDSAMGRMGFDLSLLREATEPCTRLVAAARKAGALLVFTRYVYRTDYSDGGIMVELLPALKTEGALRAGSWEVELAEPFRPLPGEHVIDKSKPSAFHGTQLDEILKQHGIETLFICGITTNCCVESTLRDGSHRDYRIWLVTDAVAETARDRHEHAIRCMTMLFARGATVAGVEKASAQLADTE